MSRLSIDPVIRVFWQRLCGESWHDPRRRIYDTELIYVSEGRCEQSLNGEVVTLEAGSLVVIPPAYWHESWCEAGATARRHCIHFDWDKQRDDSNAPLMATEGDAFDPELVHEPPVDILAHLPLVLKTDATRPIQDYLSMLVEKAHAWDPQARLALAAVLLYVMECARNEVSPGAAASQSQPRVRRAMLELKDFIDTNYDQPIGYEDFQQVTHLSRAHLCHVFRQTIGRSPTAYLLDVRMDRACRLLRETTMPISEISRRVGISDPNYFARIFRQRMGVAPSQWSERG